MITITHPVSDASNISDAANTVLGWVPGATQWLNKAMVDSTKQYQFHSETALITSIVSGLYSSDQITLQPCNFNASPEYLLSLDSNALTTIDQIMQGAKTQQALQGLTALVEDLNIVSSEQQSDVQNQIVEWGLEDNALFFGLHQKDYQSLSALLSLIKDAQYSDAIVDSAINFAAESTVDPSAFAQLSGFACRLLEGLMGKSRSGKVTASVKSKLAAIHTQLVPYVLDRLICPQLCPPQKASDAGREITTWGSTGRFVGFTDLPTGLNILAGNLDISSLIEGTDVANLITDFDSATLCFLKGVKVNKQTLSQDAKNWFFDTSNSNQSAEFVLAEDGCLTLNGLRLNLPKEN